MGIRLTLIFIAVLFATTGCAPGPEATPPQPTPTLPAPAVRRSPTPSTAATARPASTFVPASAVPIAYSTAQGVFLYEPPAGTHRKISLDVGSRISWSPDGSLLALTRTPFNSTSLDTLSPAGVRKTYAINDTFTFPIWTPDGRRILALPCPGGNSRAGDFRLLDPATGQMSTAKTADVWTWLPNVSPDVGKALLTQFPGGLTPPTPWVIFDDWARPPLDLGERLLPQCPDDYAWSAEGRFLAYYTAGGFRILDFNELRPAPKLITGIPPTHDPFADVAPAVNWSSDATRLALILRGQMWTAERARLSATRVSEVAEVYSTVAWTPAPRRGTPSTKGVLAQLLPYVNPGDNYSLAVRFEGRPRPRIIATSTEVLPHGPFLFVDYQTEQVVIAPKPTQLDCRATSIVQLPPPALQLTSEIIGHEGQELLTVTGGWYLQTCKGTIVYRWDGSRLELVSEKRAP